MYNGVIMEEGEEGFVPEDEAEEGPAALKKLREKLKKAVEEKQEYLEGWQRARADFVNYKREEVLLHSDKVMRVKAEFVEQLLPTLDAFEMALKHDTGEELKIIYKQLLDSLKKIGVEQFGVAGEKFDHHKHEALGQTGDGEKVVEVMRSGYSIGKKIIRPAQVII